MERTPHPWVSWPARLGAAVVGGAACATALTALLSALPLLSHAARAALAPLAFPLLWVGCAAWALLSPDGRRAWLPLLVVTGGALALAAALTR